MTKKSDAPAIRFKGFSDAWEQRKFDEVFDCTVPNNTLSRAELSYDEGTVLNVHYGDVLIKYGSVLDVQKDDIPRIPHRCREDFNGALLQDGDVIIADTAEDETTGKACEIGNLQGSAIVSGLHTMVCRPRNRMALGYLGYYLNSNAYHHQLLPLMQGIKVLSLSRSNIQKTSVSYPIAVKEQQLIAYYFSQLDHLITLHQRKCANLCSPSQVVFSLLFATSTFSWEQRKLGDIGKARSGVGFPDADQGGVTGVPFFKVSDMNLDGNENEMIVANNYVTAEQIADHRWSPITELPAIFFAKVGAAVMLNRKRLCRFPFLLDNNTMAYSLTPTKWDADFAKALFGTVDLTSLVQVGALPSYNAGDVESMGIYLPSLFEQEQIGAFFKLLDNLITLHQRECISFTGRADRLILTANKKRTTSSWEQRKLSEITDKVTEKNAGLQYVETFTNSAEFGIISQRDFFDHDIAKLGSLDGYYIVKNEDFVYNPRISTSAPVGPINRNKLGRTGVMSPLYTVFRPHDIDTTYLEYFFKCGYWHSFMNFNGDSGARSDRFSIRDNVFFQMPIPIPDIDEQRKIGELLTCLDNLITLHQRKFEKLTNVKKSMLEKMFPQNGSSYPEIRFKGFTDPWEQRKAKELFVSTADKGYPELPVLSATQDRGMIRRDENSINIFHDKKNEAGYKRVLPGQFVIHLRSFQGGFAHSAIEGITSPAYTVFGFSEPEKHDSEYWKYVFTSKSFIQRLETVTYGIRDGRSISYEEFLTLGFVYPSKAEQTAIARYLDKLSDLITLHQRELEKLQNIKKSMLEKMFV